MSSRRPARLALVAVALAIAAGVSATFAVSGGAGAAGRKGSRGVSATSAESPSPCGRTVGRPRYRHVLWVVMENEPYPAVIGSPSAPFTTALAKACGVAEDYQAVTHPSLPNYLALTAGSTFGISDDAYPSAHRLRGPSIFSQLQGHHETWRAYEESMTSPCQQVSAGTYAVKHNPAAYFVDLRSSCQRFDVPMGSLSSGPLAQALATNRLPNFSFVTPNVCNDGHSCPLVTADTWLRRFFARLTTSPAYRAGDLVAFVTWDEGSAALQRVPLIVVAPSVPRGTLVRQAYDHYSLLRTTEQLLGLPALRGAVGASSMVSAFHL
jgi:phospholipase C